MPGAAAALVASVGGAALMALGGVLSQTPAAGGDFAPYATGAGATAAVGGLVYMARLMATGRLVARDPAAVEKALAELSATALRLVEASHQREDSYRQLLLDLAKPERPSRGAR